MLFNSLPFLFIFFPIVVSVYFVMGFYRGSVADAVVWVVRATERNFKNAWLCLVSLYFYAYWDATYLWLLIGSILFNYTAGCRIAKYAEGRPGVSRIVFTTAIISNLAALAYYKYYNFLAVSANEFLGTHFVHQHLILPLGISFFTFTQIAFLADVYQGKAKEYNFVNYLLFVTYFPHLIAGPILHHAQMMPQFERPESFRIHWEKVAIGSSFFIIGLIKKVLIADTCALFSSPVFDAAKIGTAIPFMDAWLAAFSYSLQLYFDFSGYCDMAIGISYVFNIRLPYNFNSPYKAFNIIDFWRRWHITLSTFLRDYLYIPLGGNRGGKVRRYINLLVTMLLGGLWHGAGWTFVLWGALHGIYLIVNHAFHAFRRQVGWKDHLFGWPGRVFSTLLTFLAVMLGWVLFRSENMLAVQTMFGCMTGANGFSLTPKFIYHCKIYTHPILIPGLILIWALPNSQEWIGVRTALIQKQVRWNPFRPAGRLSSWESPLLYVL